MGKHQKHYTPHTQNKHSCSATFFVSFLLHVNTGESTGELQLFQAAQPGINVFLHKTSNPERIATVMKLLPPQCRNVALPASRLTCLYYLTLILFVCVWSWITPTCKCTETGPKTGFILLIALTHSLTLKSFTNQQLKFLKLLIDNNWLRSWFWQQRV